MKKILNLALLMMVVCTLSACASFGGAEPAQYTYSGGIALDAQPFDGYSTF